MADNQELQLHQPGYNQVGIFQESEALVKFREAMQNFCARLNALPTADSVDKTPDGKAGTILISHIQMLLDEYFFGLWSEKNFKWQQIGNEIVGSLELEVIHPVWGKEIVRTGAGAITIMVDSAPDEVKADPKAKNLWALDMQNKKPNALDMGFPKLKAECMKNAANSFGKLFGRDLNRKKVDNYNPLQKRSYTPQTKEENGTATNAAAAA
jgi:hypothetical protein